MKKKGRIVVPVNKDDTIDKGRRRFIKNAVLGSLALATGCYSSYGKRGSGLCETREMPWEDNGSQEIIPLDQRRYIIHKGESSGLFGGYKTKVEDVSYPHSDIMWDSDVKVTILDGADNVVENNIILNPHLANNWTSPEGVSIQAIFSKFSVVTPSDNWSEIAIYDPNSKVRESWYIRGSGIEDEQPPTCEEVIRTQKITDIELTFSRGLTSERNYTLFSMFIPGEEGDYYWIGEILAPSESAGGNGEISLWKKQKNMHLLSGEEYEFGSIKIKLMFLNWDREGLYGRLQITDNVSGETTDVLDFRSHEKIPYTAPGGDNYLIHCDLTPNGDRLELFAYVYSEPIILRDGDAAELEGKTYRISMDYNPEGTEIKAVYLDLDE